MGLDLSKIKGNQVILYITSKNKYSSTNANILKHYVNKKKNYCVYVTVNKQYSALEKDLKNKKVNTKNILFVDAITPLSSKVDADNAIFVGSPSALTSISLTITSALKKVPEGKRVLLLDSISTMMVYNNLGSVSKFSNFLIKKMQDWKVSGAILSIEKENSEEISDYLSQIVDKVIEVK